MAIDYDKIRNWPFQPVEQTYTEKDSILYALGLGLGADPMDEQQLRFVFEEADDAGGSPRFAALPTMPVVLAGPGFWVRDPDSGIDWKKILHGEQEIELHAAVPWFRIAIRVEPAVPTAATLIGETRVTEIIDKGADKGALIYTERTLTDKVTGTKVATLNSTTFARGDGGFGGQTGPTPSVHTLPDREPDSQLERYRDPAAIGPDLPALGRPQPVARLTFGGDVGWFQGTNSAWALQPRRRL